MRMFFLSLPLMMSMVPGASAAEPQAASIGQVQGDGARSPLLGQRVSVEGVVVGNFAEGLGGVFIQDPRGDGNARTSEGLFVQIQAAMPPTRGQRVRVIGTVVPTQLVRPWLDNGQLVNLASNKTLPVNLYWHCWNLDSAVLGALSAAIIAAAGQALTPPRATE